MKNPQPLHFSFKASKSEYEEYGKRVEDCELVTIMFHRIDVGTHSEEMTVHCRQVFIAEEEEKIDRPTCETCVHWGGAFPDATNFCMLKPLAKIDQNGFLIFGKTGKHQYCGEHHLFETWLKTVTGEYEAERKEG